MAIELSKAEKTIAVATVVVIAVFYAAFSQISKHSVKAETSFMGESKINYKMARPEQAYAEYTIEGREIDQRYEGLPEENPKSRTGTFVRNGSAPKAPVAANNKKTEAKKDDKKAKTAAQQKTAQAQAQRQRAQAYKRQQDLAKSQQEQLLKESLKRSQEQETTRDNSQEVAPAQVSYFQNQTNTQAPADEKKPKRKAYAEWKSLIFSNPSSESVSLFISAYRKSEVTQTELHTMAQELLAQEDPKMKGLALMVIRSVPSAASLTQLITAEPTLPQNYQDYVEQTYIAYFYPQNVVYLGSALTSKDRKVVARVLSLLSTNLAKLSQGDQSAFDDARNNRGGAATPANVQMRSFVALVPSLTSLAASQDPEFMPLAQQVVALIQAGNNSAVAQN